MPITGQAPPNAIDRILDDTYVPLAGGNRPFPRELLAGIDAGLAVRAADRPQSIAAWRTASVAAHFRRRRGARHSCHAGRAIRRDNVAASGTASRKRRSADYWLRAWPLFVRWRAAGSSFSPRSICAASRRTTPLRPLPAPPATDRGSGGARTGAARAKGGPRRGRKAAHRSRDAAESGRGGRIAAQDRGGDAPEGGGRGGEHAATPRKRPSVSWRPRRRRSAKPRKRPRARRKPKPPRGEGRRGRPKGAEAAEAALRLTQPDRQRLQVALTALGFVDRRHAMACLELRSREMIASWQKKNGRAATGYISADTQAVAARGRARARPLRRGAEEADRNANQTAAAQEQASSAKGGSGQCEGTYRSEWCRGAFQGFPPSCWHCADDDQQWRDLRQLDFTWRHPSPRPSPDASVPAGEVSITYNGIGQQTYMNQHFTAPLSGSVAGGVLTASGRASANGREFSVRVQCR